MQILRTDAKIPPRARAVAILEHDVLLLISPAAKKIKTVAELKKKKIAVVAENESSLTLIRTILDLSGVPDAATRIQMAPPGATLDKLFASGFGAVIAVVHASRTVKDKSFEQIARRGTFVLNAIDAAKALTRKYPVLSEETIASGTLSASPALPEEDVETVGLQWLLVAQSTLPKATVSDLARIIYENKMELALDGGFASKIEPAATEKDAFVVAHPGAIEYINDETKSFVERYSDLMYVALAALGIIGSIFAAIYTKVTRVAPEKASELATAILDIGERMADANSLDQLDELQDELEAILRRVVIGLRDGTISGDGLDTFKLGYEFVRDEIGMRRDHLKRHPPAPGRQGGGREDRAKRLDHAVRSTRRGARAGGIRALISAILRLSAACRGSDSAAARASATAAPRSGRASTPSKVGLTRPSMIAFQSARP